MEWLIAIVLLLLGKGGREHPEPPPGEPAPEPQQKGAEYPEIGSEVKCPVKPPWYTICPNKLAFWKDIGASKAKILVCQTVLPLFAEKKTAVPAQPEYKDACAKWGKAMGVPTNLIRSVHRTEQGYYPRPASLDYRSTALGLAAMLKDTAVEQGIPWHWLAHWETSVWATARYLKYRGWTKGTAMPSEADCKAARQKAGTSEEPSWWKAMRGYWGAYPAEHAHFEHSQDYASKISGLYWLEHGEHAGALQGWDALTGDFSKWYDIPEWDRYLMPFREGYATQVNGKKEYKAA